jgi:membrane protease YdiL (CAAX protease family)
MWATTLLQLPLWAGLLGAAWWACTRKGSGSLRDDFGLHMRWRDVPIGLGAGMIGQLAIVITVTNLYELLGIETDRLGDTAEELTDRAVGAVDVTLLVLTVVIAAPIVEEIFWRGLVLRSIERRTRSTPIAVIGSALVFGVIHFQVYDLLALSLAGALFAWLATRHRRLGPVTAVVVLLTL